jgi:hypothetical protein
MAGMMMHNVDVTRIETWLLFSMGILDSGPLAGGIKGAASVEFELIFCVLEGLVVVVVVVVRLLETKDGHVQRRETQRHMNKKSEVNEGCKGTMASAGARAR